MSLSYPTNNYNIRIMQKKAVTICTNRQILKVRILLQPKSLTFCSFRAIYITELIEGSNTMFEKEVKYRLCRVLLANLVGNGTISDQQAVEINKLLLEKLDPEFRSVENDTDRIGDGVKVNER